MCWKCVKFPDIVSFRKGDERVIEVKRRGEDCDTTWHIYEDSNRALEEWVSAGGISPPGPFPLSFHQKNKPKVWLISRPSRSLPAFFRPRKWLHFTFQNVFPKQTLASNSMEPGRSKRKSWMLWSHIANLECLIMLLSYSCGLRRSVDKMQNYDSKRVRYRVQQETSPKFVFAVFLVNSIKLKIKLIKTLN